MGWVREFMSNPVLAGEGLHLWRGDRHVLRGVSLELRGGQILQLTGSNGAGKTTLLRVLCGLAYVEEGNVFWRGENVRSNMHGFHSELAYVGHEPPLKADLTGRENLRYWVGMRRPLTAAQVDAAFDEVGAEDWRDRPVRTLSAGQRRRVALAGLSLLSVPLWLLDEPTTNLDTAGQTLVTRMLEAHVARGGLAVAAVHHELGVSGVTVHRMVLAS